MRLFSRIGLRSSLVEQTFTAHASAKIEGLGKGWVDRDPSVVKIKVLSTRRKVELLRLLRNSCSGAAPLLASCAGAQHLL